jgi:capsular exopolysaccharide synthesis family protein
VLRRRWLLILLCTIALPAAAFLFSVNQADKFEGTAQVLLDQQNLASTLTGAQQPFKDPERFVQTQADIARSPVVARHVLELAGREGGTSAFLDTSDVSLDPTSDVLTFTVTDTDREGAAQLANLYARAYVEYRRELDVAAYRNALQEVRARLSDPTQSQSPTLRRDLENKEQQLQTLQTLSSSNATIVRESPRGAQVQPRPTRNTVLGLFLGIALGIGLAFLWEALDTRLRSADEISRILDMPLLARATSPPAGTQELLMLANPRAAGAESFRVLKTNLDIKRLTRPFKSLMVTSALQGEGKSTTIANLAVACARAGSDVVLMDVDFRRPFAHQFFGHNNALGLTSVALGEISLHAALREIDLSDAASTPESGAKGRLRVLTTGPRPPDPGELIGSQVIARLLKDVEEQCDLVLVDTSPILGLADAISLSARVDAIFVVARLGVLRRPAAREASRVFDSMRAKILGYVLTDAAAEPGYGYGYGYGYGREQDAARAEPAEDVRATA